MPAAFLAAGATVFLAVFILALAVQSLLLERRQAYRTLQALRAMELRPSDLRNRELARPATERLLRPLYQAALAVGRRCTPAGWRDATRRRLVTAGGPGSWDEDRVLVAKVAGLALGAIAGLAVLAVGLAWPLRLLVVAGLGALGYHVPNVVLANAVQRRQASLR
jgi:tight adherence protein C